MKTSATVSTTSNAAVAQVHWQSLLWEEKFRLLNKQEGQICPVEKRMVMLMIILFKHN